MLGFPSPTFRQELDDAAEIGSFCSTTYGVSFPMFAPVEVAGPGRHPLFARLAEVPDADGEAGPVAWNLEKLVVAPGGEVHRFRSGVEPDAPQVVAVIEAALGRRRYGGDPRGPRTGRRRAPVRSVRGSERPVTSPADRVAPTPEVPVPSTPHQPPARSRPAAPLSPRELQILRRLDCDRTLAQIAAELYVSHNTIKTQVQSVYRKLGVTRRADAVAAAQRLPAH